MNQHEKESRQRDSAEHPCIARKSPDQVYDMLNESDVGIVVSDVVKSDHECERGQN